jgi:hypothetical protein
MTAASNDDNGNGKVTLAVLAEKINTLTGIATESRDDIKTLNEKAAHQEEFNKAVKCQIWDGSESRIQTALDKAGNCNKLIWVLFVPLTLSIITGIITLFVKLLGGG